MAPSQLTGPFAFIGVCWVPVSRVHSVNTSAERATSELAKGNERRAGTLTTDNGQLENHQTSSFDFWKVVLNPSPTVRKRYGPPVSVRPGKLSKPTTSGPKLVASCS